VGRGRVRPVSRKPQGVVAGLEAVGTWRATVERDVLQEHSRVIAALDEAHVRLRDAERTVAELEGQRRRVDARVSRIDAEETRRTRDAIRRGLAHDEALVVRRADDVRQAFRERVFEAAGVGAAEAASLGALDELGALGAADPDLPPAVRRALQDRDRHASRLLPHVLSVETDADPIDAPAAAVAAVASMELDEGLPTALELVLPLPWSVYADPGSHGDDLCSRLAWRVVAALGVALRDVGAADAPVRYASEGGRLAVQVWLGDADVVGSVKDALSAGFDRIHEESGELRAANVELYVAWLDPEILEDPEEADHG
jgi:hypothetical protein